MTNFLMSSLRDAYQIDATSLALLPVGADMNVSIYKVEARDQKTYFVKLRRGHIDDVSIAIVELLQSAGIEQLIPPIKTTDNKLFHQTSDCTLVVFPFVQGLDGFSRALTDEQWIALGQALRKVHEVSVPASIKSRIRREDFSPKWRDCVRALYAPGAQPLLGDEIASNLWHFLHNNRSRIERLVDRAKLFSETVRRQAHQFVLCHGDIHGGNVLIDDKNNLYIVDWDAPILAPKERDLMFIGGGVGNVWYKPHEQKLFYRGYGQTKVDMTLLAYYRYERIVEDIVDFDQGLLKQTGNNGRHEMYQHFLAMFAQNGVVDIAFDTDKHVTG